MSLLSFRLLRYIVLFYMFAMFGVFHTIIVFSSVFGRFCFSHLFDSLCRWYFPFLHYILSIMYVCIFCICLSLHYFLSCLTVLSLSFSSLSVFSSLLFLLCILSLLSLLSLLFLCLFSLIYCIICYFISAHQPRPWRNHLSLLENRLSLWLPTNSTELMKYKIHMYLCRMKTHRIHFKYEFYFQTTKKQMHRNRTHSFPTIVSTSGLLPWKKNWLR